MRRLDIICDKCGEHNINDSYWLSIGIHRMLPTNGGAVSGIPDYEYTFCINCKQEIEKKIFDILLGNI